MVNNRVAMGYKLLSILEKFDLKDFILDFLNDSHNGKDFKNSVSSIYFEGQNKYLSGRLLPNFDDPDGMIKSGVKITDDLIEEYCFLKKSKMPTTLPLLKEYYDVNLSKSATKRKGYKKLILLLLAFCNNPFAEVNADDLPDNLRTEYNWVFENPFTGCNFDGLEKVKNNLQSLIKLMPVMEKSQSEWNIEQLSKIKQMDQFISKINITVSMGYSFNNQSHYAIPKPLFTDWIYYIFFRVLAEYPYVLKCGAILSVDSEKKANKWCGRYFASKRKDQKFHRGGKGSCQEKHNNYIRIIDRTWTCEGRLNKNYTYNA